MSVDYIKRVIDEAARKGFKVISFTGGEPLLFLPEIASLMAHAGKAGIKYIRTGTNGFLFLNPDSPRFTDKVTKIAETLAETPVRNFWISIDSAVPETHEHMRGFPGVIAGIEKALPIFHDHGIYPSANLGVNRNIGGESTNKLEMSPLGDNHSYLTEFYEAFRSAFRDFYNFIYNMGFTMVNTCYPMSVDEASGDDRLNAVYAATSTDRIVRFSNAEKSALFKALFETIPEFRSQMRIFSPRSSLYALYKDYINGTAAESYACRGGIDFFFLDSKDGHLYPCGYRGQDDLGAIWNLKLDALDNEPFCRQCDWECFRDPSELFGPLIEGIANPGKLIGQWRRDKTGLRVWLKDMKYYHACDLFNGRVPPNYRKLQKFG